MPSSWDVIHAMPTQIVGAPPGDPAVRQRQMEEFIWWVGRQALENRISTRKHNDQIAEAAARALGVTREELSARSR